MPDSFVAGFETGEMYRAFFSFIMQKEFSNLLTCLSKIHQQNVCLNNVTKLTQHYFFELLVIQPKAIEKKYFFFWKDCFES